MAIWAPDISQYDGPRYLAIADALTADIRHRRLAPGDRLPTHRDLAYRLGVTVGTVTRAYSEAERRGLIGGEVGRGTYVRGDLVRRLPEPFQIAAQLPQQSLIDLSVNFPTPMSGDALLAESLQAIAARPGIARLMDYHPHAGLLQHREAGAQWMSNFGFNTTADRVIVTSGGQHAMTAVIGALTQPGDIVVTENLTYPGMRRLADFLRLKLHGLPLDQHGIDPEALDAACRNLSPKALYCVTNIHNPLGYVVPESRRREIAEVCRRHGVRIVEDDLYGFLLDEQMPSLTSFAPELGHYVNSVSKSMCPGLRVGYLAIPPEGQDAFAQVVRSTTWMATPLTAEIASNWIQNGTGLRLVHQHKAEAIARQQLAHDILGAWDIQAHRAGYHLWLNLPEGWNADNFALEARLRQVGVSPTGTFALNRAAPAGVRLCLCAPAERATLQQALEILADLLRQTPGSRAGMGVV
jgi:DNA-binding transcriptional MocR family regulator